MPWLGNLLSSGPSYDKQTVFFSPNHKNHIIIFKCINNYFFISLICCEVF